jgi:mono/diheme cytochrome c family protein
MKQIICMVLLAVIWFSGCSASKKTVVGGQRIYEFTHTDSLGRMFSEIWTAPKLESLGMREIPSKYFDRAMHLSDSRFSTIPFYRLLEKFKLKRGEDAVLLNCIDDYQGILSFDDINHYDIQLATKIKLAPGSNKPDWLNPLLILVPDGQQPPFQERFITANIRELKLVRINDYYAPLEKIAGSSSKAQEGLEVFKNNCLFCHSLKGRGGNKGARLLEAYDFSYKSDQIRMLEDFRGFHNKDNQDKQDVEQFITQKKLERVVDFLKNFDDLKN